MLPLLGSIALGVAWGWLGGLFRLLEIRSARQAAIGISAGLVATAVLCLLVWLMASTWAAIAFVCAALFGLLGHSAWLESLRAQSTSSS